MAKIGDFGVESPTSEVMQGMARHDKLLGSAGAPFELHLVTSDNTTVQVYQSRMM